MYMQGGFIKIVFNALYYFILHFKLDHICCTYYIINTKVVGIQVGLCSIGEIRGRVCSVCCDILYFISRDTLSFCVQSYLERSEDEGDVKARLS